MNESVVEVVFPANSYTFILEQNHKNTLLYHYNYPYQLKTWLYNIPEIMLLLFSSWKSVYITLHHVTIDDENIWN